MNLPIVWPDWVLALMPPPPLSPVLLSVAACVAIVFLMFCVILASTVGVKRRLQRLEGALDQLSRQIATLSAAVRPPMRTANAGVAHPKLFGRAHPIARSPAAGRKAEARGLASPADDSGFDQGGDDPSPDDGVLASTAPHGDEPMIGEGAGAELRSMRAARSRRPAEPPAEAAMGREPVGGARRSEPRIDWPS